jgi:hypothetical protein
MPLTSKEVKAALIEYIHAVLQDKYPEEVLEETLDAQEVETKVISYSTIQIRVLPCGSGACRDFTIKISEQQ